MSEPITSFRNENFFLSNFYLCTITIRDITYSSAEAAFQAQNTLDIAERMRFAEMTPGQAKKYGKKVDLRCDWEDLKVDIMTAIVLAKFQQNPNLRELLLATGDRELIEGNNWNDTFWGVSNKSGKGQNNLGKILMDVRSYFKRGGD